MLTRKKYRGGGYMAGIVIIGGGVRHAPQSAFCGG